MGVHTGNPGAREVSWGFEASQGYIAKLSQKQTNKISRVIKEIIML